MPGGLDEYREKRDFARTPEPPPGVRGKRGEPVFVVHKHDASRLHYDLRLEMDGVLRSWAIPKGFSYDPQDKHLALRTEDHPLAYEDFHGVIPPGQYGAGTMTIWDRGRYEVVRAESAPAAVAAGEVKVILRGRKLRGEWHLVKTNQGKDTWLLFKSKDRYAGSPRDSALGIDLAAAREAPLPRALRAMEPGREAAVFSDPAFLFEMRFAGRRAFAAKDGEAARIRGLRRRLPEVERDLHRLRAERAVLDGVLVVTDDGGRPSKALLEERLAGGNEREIRYYAFDLLHVDEFDLCPLAQSDRKAALRAVVPPGGHVLYVDHVPGDGAALAEAVAAAGLSGMVAKRAGAPYVPGPSPDWVEVPVAGEARGDVAAALHRGRAAPAGRRRVRFTNLHKVFWPAEGFTKGDLIAYYGRVSEALLPYLHERPLHLNRYPDGITGKNFYQKDAVGLVPPWFEMEAIESGHRGVAIHYLIVNDRDSLLTCANLASIDLHPWMSRRGSLGEPDYAVIDLDPKEAPFVHVIAIARAVGRLLHEIGLRPLLKTSGATGLHVHVPLRPGYTYEQSRMFCEAVARVVAKELPDVATVERVVGNRGGKVYVDFGQNRRGQTIVPPYVPRPVRGATVSTPLAWDELEDDLRPARFTIQTVPTRLEERGDLFRPLLEDRQDLLPAIEALQARVGGRSP
jgi:bifunctional non-homologous end joining protein LigD